MRPMNIFRQWRVYLLDQVKHDGLRNHVDYCSLYNIEIGVDEKLCINVNIPANANLTWEYILITSTSTPSRSDNVPDAFKVGGGGSIAAIFFLFFEAKKLPKNPLLLST